MQRILMMEIDSTDSRSDREVREVIHYDGADGCDYTLCGVGEEEDARYPHEFATPTTKRVTCERCIAIRDHVLGKRKSA